MDVCYISGSKVSAVHYIVIGVIGYRFTIHTYHPYPNTCNIIPPSLTSSVHDKTVYLSWSEYAPQYEIEIRRTLPIMLLFQLMWTCSLIICLMVIIAGSKEVEMQSIVR